jgi:nudix-type nucleoside diphosphatase (YffH/AdpP family)
MVRTHKPSVVVVRDRRRILDDFLSVDEAEVSYERYDGGMCGPVRRLSLERGDSVAVLLLERGDDGGHVILVEQFRFPTYGHEGGGWLQETLAGVIDTGEDAVAALRREALEEVGYRVGEVEHIATYFASPGGSSERISVYFAEVRAADRIDGHGGGLAAEHEDIRIVRTPLAAFFDALDRGAYRDSKICVAGFWLRGRLGAAPA